MNDCVYIHMYIDRGLCIYTYASLHLCKCMCKYIHRCMIFACIFVELTCMCIYIYILNYDC